MKYATKWNKNTRFAHKFLKPHLPPPPTKLPKVLKVPNALKALITLDSRFTTLHSVKITLFSRELMLNVLKLCINMDVC